MKKIIIITSVFLIAMLGASFIFAADHETSPWKFSDQLNDGDKFEWKVRFYENDSAVTTADPEDVPFINDSLVELEIYSNIHSIDANGAPSEADLNSAFSLRIDGANQPLWDNGSINQWLLIFLNPTDLFLPSTTEKYNYFHYLIDNSETHFLMNATGVIDTTNDSYRVSEERIYTPAEDNGENRKVNEDAEYELGRGVLRYFSHYEEFYDESNAVVGKVDAQFFLTGSSGGGDGMDFDFNHFSDSLNTGDVFTWDVTKLAGTGEIVTIAGSVGSQMQIEVLSEPELVDFKDSSVNLDTVFYLTFDGVHHDIENVFDESFINIIFPVFVDYENGTIITNFFENLRDNPDIINLDDGETVTFTTDSVTHTVTRDENGYSKTENVTWDIQSGVMIHAYFSETNAAGVLVTEVEFERTTVTNPIDTNSNTDTESTAPNPLPGMTYFWALSALIAIPLFRRKNN